jgi:hypothetical protein
LQYTLPGNSAGMGMRNTLLVGGVSPSHCRQPSDLKQLLFLPDGAFPHVVRVVFRGATGVYACRYIYLVLSDFFGEKFRSAGPIVP